MWMIYLMLIGTASQRTFYPLWLGMSIMIYWLGHIGIYKFGIQQERKQLRSYSIKTKIYPVAEKQKNEHIVTIEKLVKKEKRYLDASLTLDKIAEELNLSKSHLSRIINSELGTGFPEYINSLRVEEAKHYLNNPAFANYTLVAIGLEAGFNSKTTFNNAFKKATGLTPSEFKNQCELSTDN
jgi:AraC-like DNA-binding protein